MGIGTGSPVSSLNIAGNGSGIGTVTTAARSDGNGTFIWGQTSRGTLASPSASNSTDGAFLLAGYLHNGTSFNPVGNIGLVGDGSQTGSSSPGAIVLATTTSGSTAVSEKMRITNAGSVGIGTNSPYGIMDLEKAHSDVFLNLRNTSSSAVRPVGLQLENFPGSTANTGPTSFNFIRHRGSSASPTAIQSGDVIGQFGAYGDYGGGSLGQGAQMFFQADGAFTGSSFPTSMHFATTPSGSTAGQERMTILANGNVGVGNTAPGQKLSVAGTIESTSGGMRYPDSTTQTTAYPGAAKRALVTVNATNTQTSTAAITFGTVAYDTGTFWNGFTPTRLTVPAGVTLVRVCGDAYGYFTGGGSGQIGSGIIKNGAFAPGLPHNLTEGHNNTVPYIVSVCSAPIVVTTGDYFEYTFGPNGVGTVSMPVDVRTWFSIEEVR